MRSSAFRVPAVLVGIGVGLGTATGTRGSEGLPAGAVTLYPAVFVNGGVNDNLFNSRDAPVSDRYLTVEAPITMRLPFLESSWDLRLVPGLNQFQDNPDLDGTTYAAATELDLHFARGSRLQMTAEYVSDYLNTVFDPEGEVAFNATDYGLWRGSVLWEHPISQAHGMRIQSFWERLRFQDDSGDSSAPARGFIDYTDYTATLSYLRFLGGGGNLFVDLTGTVDYPDRPLFEVQEDRWVRAGLAVGYEERIDSRNLVRVALGYEQLEFDNSDDSDFAGLVGWARYRRGFGEVVWVQAEVLRQVSPSAFNVNNYYRTDRISAGVEWRPGSLLFFIGDLSYQENQYPDAAQYCIEEPCDPADPNFRPALSDASLNGIHRRDHLLRGRAALGFQLSRTSSLRLRYAYEERNSNMYPFEYDGSRLTLEFHFGWSPDREFI